MLLCRIFVDFFVVCFVGKTDVNLETHSFVVPKKEIKSPADIAAKWEKSEVSFLLHHTWKIGFVV